jgi:hypothetical protein
MPLCCATIHVTVRSCNEEGPVEGAEVTVSKPGETEGEIVTVASGVTDDTGTLTFLVDDAGTYFLHSEYNGGEADKTVEAECGINNVDILFAATDKICVRLSPASYVGPTLGVSASKDGSLVDSCSLGTGVARCCLNLPGPGTYTLSSDDPLATIEPPEIEVKEEDCGDKIATLIVPTAGETCERIIHFNLCGCPATGTTISVAMPSGRVLSSSVDVEGAATFLVPLAECGQWSGSTYTVDLPGVLDTLTGTVSGDEMTIPDPGASSGRWCYPDCVGPIPGTLFWTPGASWPPYARFPQSLAFGLNVGGPGIAGWYGINELSCIEESWVMETKVVIPRTNAQCDTAPNAYIKVDIYGPPGTCQHEDVPFSEYHTTIPLTGNAGELYCPVNLAPGGGTLSE